MTNDSNSMRFPVCFSLRKTYTRTAHLHLQSVKTKTQLPGVKEYQTGKIQIKGTLSVFFIQIIN